jgi:hypothetical protein
MNLVCGKQLISSRLLQSSGLWNNRKMTKRLIALEAFLLVMSTAVMPLTPALAQSKPDPKVVKECETISNKYDALTFSLINGLPLDVPNRDVAQRELFKLDASPNILIECGYIDAKTWKSIKSDYSKVITSANQTLSNIVSKYKILPEKKESLSKISA